MLAAMESGLVALVDGSALKPKLKLVSTLPDLDGDNLVKRMAAEAPAVYVVAGMSIGIEGGSMRVPFGLACVARNARGHEDARRGDGKTLGLYQMLMAVLGLVENGPAGDYRWRVTGVDYMNDDKLAANGLTVGLVRIETTAEMPAGIDETRLAEFASVRSDYDVMPHESAAEHAKWSGDPQDLSVSRPELQDNQQLR